MDWIEQAKQLFQTEKPAHFTNYLHCEECEEHDQTLLNHDIDTISLDELGSPAWDPICFCSDEGKQYYLPALVRLCLESMDDDFYFAQLLFHLEADGPKNSFYLSCNNEQRRFIFQFIEFIITEHSDELEQSFSVDEAFRAREIWNGTD
jgi:hypothetical protein